MSEEKKKEESAKISRREFLKDAGLVVGGAAVGSMALANACKGTTTTETVTKTVTGAPGVTTSVTTTITAPPVTKIVEVPVGGQTISFTVNGNAYKMAVDPCWDLQYFLHDIMGWYDIKTFCYRGACGSCSVIMDGKPILSCMTLAVDADGTKIETAQGIALANHPLINSYVKYHCMQCGYCTPGFVVTSKALLDHNSSPTDDEIVEALAGNLCRCGTYPQHVLAVREAANVLKGGK
jgi:aerobic-type carbon monoxide dehydrogenase small subunit (CoxS/CutS family)